MEEDKFKLILREDMKMVYNYLFNTKGFLKI